MQDDQGRRYDVVIIAADSMNALHDQQVCFQAQGWEVMESNTRQIESELRGNYPGIFVTIRQDGTPPQNAILAFRSPERMVTYNRAKIGFFTYRLKNRKPGMGFSYRFIGIDPSITMEDLEFFAKNYMDKLYENSEGKV